VGKVTSSTKKKKNEQQQETNIKQKTENHPQNQKKHKQQQNQEPPHTHQGITVTMRGRTETRRQHRKRKIYQETSSPNITLPRTEPASQEPNQQQPPESEHDLQNQDQDLHHDPIRSDEKAEEIEIETVTSNSGVWVEEPTERETQQEEDNYYDDDEQDDIPFSQVANEYPDASPSQEFYAALREKKNEIIEAGKIFKKKVDNQLKSPYIQHNSNMAKLFETRMPDATIIFPDGKPKKVEFGKAASMMPDCPKILEMEFSGREMDIYLVDEVQAYRFELALKRWKNEIADEIGRPFKIRPMLEMRNVAIRFHGFAPTATNKQIHFFLFNTIRLPKTGLLTTMRTRNTLSPFYSPSEVVLLYDYCPEVFFGLHHLPEGEQTFNWCGRKIKWDFRRKPERFTRKCSMCELDHTEEQCWYNFKDPQEDNLNQSNEEFKSEFEQGTEEDEEDYEIDDGTEIEDADLNVWASKEDTVKERKQKKEQAQTPNPTKIFMGGLPRDIEHSELEQMFIEREFYGMYITIPTDREGKTRAFAFVDFPTPQEADRAFMSYAWVVRNKQLSFKRAFDKVTTHNENPTHRTEPQQTTTENETLEEEHDEEMSNQNSQPTPTIAQQEQNQSQEQNQNQPTQQNPLIPPSQQPSPTQPPKQAPPEATTPTQQEKSPKAQDNSNSTSSEHTIPPIREVRDEDRKRAKKFPTFKNHYFDSPRPNGNSREERTGESSNNPNAQYG
jgi:hypothetical protein